MGVREKGVPERRECQEDGSIREKAVPEIREYQREVQKTKLLRTLNVFS